MATLTGSTIASSYEQLLSLPDGGGDTTTLVAVTDGDAIDTSNVFPQGMTIFGRWTGYRLASGSIIAYKGTF